ncbi:hypothetical protein QC761_506958 [Podospora bellae-mahoneyi]|uniref:Infection structure specific protein n=1 Tax=Podospora bellae-mahoneyi TaxID=2093777 RepID=A0ABR0FE30_9PEZI|nr:hypothetical protein QC761_506958 [Podospora bellae-mahoneyi]
MKPATTLPFLTVATVSPNLHQPQPRQEATTATASPTPTRTTTSPCEQSYSSLNRDRPTQHPDLIPSMLDDFSTGQSTITDLSAQCSWAQNWSRTAAGTVISSWNAAHSSWISKHKVDVTNFAVECATVFDEVDTVAIMLALAATDVGGCVTAQRALNGELSPGGLVEVLGAAPAGSAGGDEGDDGEETDDDGEGGTSTTGTTSTSTAGAARETGYVMGVAAVGVAVAGVMGGL